MIVVGIDTNSFGFHIVSNEPVLMPADDFPHREATYGWSLAKGDAQERRAASFDAARRFFSALPAGAHVFVEEPLILPKNIETTRKLVMMGGVIEAAFWQSYPDATFYWVDVATWRKKILGRGSGRKEEMKRLADEVVHRLWWDLPDDRWLRWEIDYEKQPDLFDAHCIMLYGEQALAGRPEAA